MKKKLSLILCLCFMVLGLAACGEDPRSVDYFGSTYDELESGTQQQVSALRSLTEETAAYIQASGDEKTIRLVETWFTATEGLEDYQGLGEFRIAKTHDTITVDQIVKFSGREVIISYVYKYNYELKTPELADASVDKVYTMGEKMTKAALNTLMGMGTVFVVLILISLIIYSFRFISYFQGKSSVHKKREEGVKKTVVDQIGSREKQQLTDNLELVAVISAAIAASTGSSADSFVVRSIHRR
ncbi:MAG: OadG family transporter subunit [Roseburia sp.]